MHIAIVEDDPVVQEQLRQYMDRYFEGRKDRNIISVFSDGDEILEDYRADYDLILLDIQMKRLDGLETARRLRKMDENVYLIFVTNLANYAIKGYAVNALDFVLKPVNYLMLSAILQRVEKLLAAKEKAFFALPTENGMIRMDVKEIYFVETQKHMSTVHTSKGNYQLRESMKNMEDMLKDYHFFRCNNCYLVNLACVEQVNRNEAMVAGETLVVSRPRYKAFMEALTQYLGGGPS